MSTRQTVEIRFRGINMEVELHAFKGSDNSVTKYGQPVEQPYDAEYELLHVCVGSDSLDVLDLLGEDVITDIKNKCILELTEGSFEPPEDDRF